MISYLHPRITTAEVHFTTSLLRPSLDTHFALIMQYFFTGGRRSLLHMVGKLLQLGVLGGLYVISNLIDWLLANPHSLTPTSAIITLKVKPRTDK